jgi:NACHT domain
LPSRGPDRRLPGRIKGCVGLLDDWIEAPIDTRPKRAGQVGEGAQGLTTTRELELRISNSVLTGLYATIGQMRRTDTDRRAAEGGAVRLGWLLALTGILLLLVVVVLEVWATPPGWLLSGRRQTVGMLHWVKANWLSTAALSTAAAVIGVLTPFLLRWLDRRRPMPATGQTHETQHQRTVMLRRVRYKWITGVLEPSLAPAARLVLGLEHRPDLLQLGGRAVRRPGRPPEPISADTPIIEVFDKVGGGLLILGAPGAGKTTMLLQLCDQLLNRAERDLDQPMPVVANLASWAGQRLPLDAWLVEELARGYQVPRRIATHWVEQEALVPLLDGLDEVAEAHRPACAQAINAWRGEHGLVPLVVCCRSQELQTLGVSLRLEEVVQLQPPTEAEVDRYLGALEASGTPIDEVRTALVTGLTRSGGGELGRPSGVRVVAVLGGRGSVAIVP